MRNVLLTVVCGGVLCAAVLAGCDSETTAATTKSRWIDAEGLCRKWRLDRFVHDDGSLDWEACIGSEVLGELRAAMAEVERDRRDLLARSRAVLRDETRRMECGLAGLPVTPVEEVLASVGPIVPDNDRPATPRAQAVPARTAPQWSPAISATTPDTDLPVPNREDLAAMAAGAGMDGIATAPANQVALMPPLPLPAPGGEGDADEAALANNDTEESETLLALAGEGERNRAPARDPKTADLARDDAEGTDDGDRLATLVHEGEIDAEEAKALRAKQDAAADLLAREAAAMAAETDGGETPAEAPTAEAQSTDLAAATAESTGTESTEIAPTGAAPTGAAPIEVAGETLTPTPAAEPILANNSEAAQRRLAATSLLEVPAPEDLEALGASLATVDAFLEGSGSDAPASDGATAADATRSEDAGLAATELAGLTVPTLEAAAAHADGTPAASAEDASETLVVVAGETDGDAPSLDDETVVEELIAPVDAPVDTPAEGTSGAGELAHGETIEAIDAGSPPAPTPATKEEVILSPEALEAILVQAGVEPESPLPTPIVPGDDETPDPVDDDAEADTDADAEGEGEGDKAADGENPADDEAMVADDDAGATGPEMVTGDGPEEESAIEVDPDAGAETEAAETELTEEQKKMRELANQYSVETAARKLEARNKLRAGMDFFQNQLYTQSLEMFEQALRLDPELEDARIYKIRARQILNLPAGPEETAEVMDQIEQTEALRIQAQELKMNRDLEKATRLYIEAVNPDAETRSNPRDVQIQIALADLREAVTIINAVDALLRSAGLPKDTERLIRLRSQGLRAQVLRAEADLRAESAGLNRAQAREDAIAQRQRATENVTKSIDELFVVAQRFADEKRYDKALSMLDRIEKLDPRNPKTWPLRLEYRRLRHQKVRLETDEDMEHSEKNWAIDIRQAHILPRDLVIYPDNWDAIRNRVKTQRVDTAIGPEERRIMDQLDSVQRTFEFTQMPLIDVLRELENIGRVNIILDPEVDAQQEVNLSVRSMSLLRVMEWLMELQGLQYRIENQAIYIRPAGVGGRKVVLQLYPVADLVHSIRDYYAPAIADDDDDFGDDDDDFGAVDETPLPDRIQETISVDSWTEQTSIDMWEDNLLIMQTAEVHAQITQYLRRLREMQKQQVMVEGRFLSVNDTFFDDIGFALSNYTWDGHQDGTDVRTGLAIQPGPSWTARNADLADTTTGQNLGLSAGYAHTMHSGARNTLHQLANQIITPAAQAARPIGLPLLHAWQVGFTIDAAQSSTTGSVMHNPRLLVSNGHNAYVIVRSVTNYVGNATVQGIYVQPEISQFAQGVTWDVRPVISFDRKYITVRTRPKFETIDPNPEIESVRIATHPGDGVGAILWDVNIARYTSEVIDFETNATVPDGGTVLIGGEVTDNRSEAVRGVPMLSNVPGLGRLFRFEAHSKVGRNRVIILSARIVELQE